MLVSLYSCLAPNFCKWAYRKTEDATTLRALFPHSVWNSAKVTKERGAQQNFLRKVFFHVRRCSVCSCVFKQCLFIKKLMMIMTTLRLLLFERSKAKEKNGNYQVSHMKHSTPTFTISYSLVAIRGIPKKLCATSVLMMTVCCCCCLTVKPVCYMCARTHGQWMPVNKLEPKKKYEHALCVFTKEMTLLSLFCPRSCW